MAPNAQDVCCNSWNCTPRVLDIASRFPQPRLTRIRFPSAKQPPFPGSQALERRIKSLVRWNALAMVMRANKRQEGIGGHISTYASAATLYEVAFHHFFRAQTPDGDRDLVYFQGHASPGIYSRAFLEGRISQKKLENFRREMAEGGGLSSYPHPWLMKDFWEFPTVSMGLGPIQAIYHARFIRYLENRGLKQCNQGKVWAFLGDGETDEPESLGAITLASRENGGIEELLAPVDVAKLAVNRRRRRRSEEEGRNHPRQMAQPAEIADDLRQCRPDNILIEGRERERQHQSRQHESKFTAGHGRGGFHNDSISGGPSLSKFNPRCCVPLAFVLWVGEQSQYRFKFRTDWKSR